MTVLDTAQWYHVALTYDSLAVRMYINGSLEFENYVIDNFPISSTGSAHIGKSVGSNNVYYDGNTDEISVWEIALTQQEIQQYMTCPPTGNEAGLVGYWNFEEGQGTTAYDQTPNGNDGTINGAAYSTNVPAQSCGGALTNVNGCDSTATLNLTINQADTSYTNITACDTFSWNGTNYTQSGTYYNSGIVSNTNTFSLDFGSTCGSTAPSMIDYGDVLDMPGSFSFGGWAYAECAELLTILSKRECCPYNGFEISINNTEMFFQMWDNNGSSSIQVTHPAILNQWLHDVGVFNAGNNLELYINGVLVNTTSTVLSGLSDNVAPFLIGAHTNYPGLVASPSITEWDWLGELDEIFIYDRGLSSTEVFNIYSCNMPQNNLQGYWNFERKRKCLGFWR